jgi:clan AA aspartic protease
VTRSQVVGLQPRVGVSFRIASQPDIQIECVVDTGFEGALALPAAAVTALGLPYLTDLDANLADGTNVSTAVFVGTILWQGAETRATVLALGQRPLLGTALLDAHRLEVEFTDGGLVQIDVL